jgi:hypothetical protein
MNMVVCMHTKDYAFSKELFWFQNKNFYNTGDVLVVEITRPSRKERKSKKIQLNESIECGQNS